MAQVQQFVAGGGVPDADGSVGEHAGGHPAAVGREIDVGDAGAVTLQLPFEPKLRLAGGADCPERHEAVKPTDGGPRRRWDEMSQNGGSSVFKIAWLAPLAGARPGLPAEERADGVAAIPAEGQPE